MSKYADTVKRTRTCYTLVNNKKGITLVALIVTIIILLILAGISIASLTGKGLFEKAKLAKEKQENAEIKEESILKEYENYIGDYVDSTREEYVSKGKVLWKNNNIKDEFTAQTITLNDEIKNYDYIKIFFISDTVDNNTSRIEWNRSFSNDTLVINNELRTILYYSWYMSGWAGHPLCYRTVTGNSNKVTFGAAYTSGSGSNNALNNYTIIPYNIIGYKF